MPKYLGRKRIGFCQRTGVKVRYEDLVEDGETGALVEAGWDDPEHPQKYLPDVDTEPRAVSRPSPTTEPADVIVLGQLYDD